MANPFSLIIAGVTGAGTGGDLLTFPSPTATTTPYVDLGTLSLTMSGDGSAGGMNFSVFETKTPSGTSPWWRSGAVYDNARVQFFDSRYSATTPLFLGFITSIEGELLENGVGTRANVQVAQASAWFQNTIVRNPKTNINVTSSMDSFTQGGTESTDRSHINALLAKIHDQVNDSTTRQILDTSLVSGNRAIFTGSAQIIGKQTFKATTLQSALDQIAEAAGGVAEIQYRYWIDGDGRLNYGPKSVAETYASAPAEIVTDPANVRIGSTTTTTRILARDLRVTLDHDRIVKGIFVQAADTVARYDSNSAYPSTPTNDPYFRTYTGTYSRHGAGQASRNGPLPHEVFSAPKVKNLSDRGATIGSLARATMVTRGKPVRTVSFTVGGASLSQTSNPDWSYGYSQGYAAAAATPYALIKAWLPGQYVKINAPSLDLANVILYIPSVTMRFAEGGGTYQVQYEIEADYRRQYLKGLSVLIGAD